jgi:hypothetical protein
MKRLVLTLIALLPAGSAEAATCSGFPWTVTATSGGGASVLVHVCGTYAGCHPHGPTVSVVGSEIRITLKQAELPDCICIQPNGEFEENIIIPAVPPGDYAVIVSDQDCAQLVEAGRTTYSALAASTIPTLDGRGLAVLALLIAAAGFWRLRP